MNLRAFRAPFRRRVRFEPEADVRNLRRLCHHELRSIDGVIGRQIDDGILAGRKDLADL